MSPILVRPVREQLEHDRLIRMLQAARAKRKTEVKINPGAEQNEGVGSGAQREYPDLVIVSTDKGRKIQSIIEVETGESVNHLEALAQWAHYGRLRHPFHLYVPAASADVARRLCADQQIPVDELWAYHHVGDQIRFTLVQRSEVKSAAARRGRGATVEKGPARATRKGAAVPAARTARPARAAARPAGNGVPARRSTGKAKAARKPTPPARKVTVRQTTSTKKAARRK